MSSAVTSVGSAPRRRRADAERNVEKILDGALACIQSDGDLTMAAIARAAGFSRVTLYAHFPTREALLESVIRRAIATTSMHAHDAAIDQGPAPAALRRLLESSWEVLSSYRNLYALASSVMTPSQLRDHHEPLVGPLERLLIRGQVEGGFRADLPSDWLVATIFTLLHLAAEQVATGRLDQRNARRLAITTIMAALAPPA
ncbi:MAG: TetR/AcrR family transcriptional regulator [Jiangellaceae bacterium]